MLPAIITRRGRAGKPKAMMPKVCSTLPSRSQRVLRTAGMGQILSNIRKGSVALMPACRPPGPGRRDDHRVPSKHRRYDQSEYEPFWAVAEVLDLPLSLHRAIRTETSRNRAIASSDAWRARPGAFGSDIGSNCSV
jgi:hypothetical protein